MVDLSTTYLGLQLKNPVIAGSSGLSRTAKGVADYEAAGAGAVVLKSIFEEEIMYEHDDIVEEAEKRGLYPIGQFDYYDHEIKGQKIGQYTQLISDCKTSVSIPVIASVNCVYSHEWLYFANYIEQAGADALELNMFFLPSDFDRGVEEKEAAYFRIIERVLQEVSIPVALKISYYFTDLGRMIQRLSTTGVKGLVLFNRFYSPDFDIDKLEVVPSNVLSHPSDLPLSLRWIAIMAQRVSCDLAASTGVHDGSALIKQLLAGANAVQVVSALYNHGRDHIGAMLTTLDEWMTAKGYGCIDDFRGQMSQARSSNPAAYERVQFMRYFGA